MLNRSESSLPLILFHGLLSSPQEFGLIAHPLRARGIAHHAATMPGYTLATNVTHPDWRQWRQAAVARVDEIAGDRPVILGGLCMGGILAAATALQRRQRIAGLVLMSPTFTYDGWNVSPLRHLRHLAYWTRLDNVFSVSECEPYGIKNEKIRKWVVRELRERAQSAIGPARIPLRALRQAERMMAEVRNHLAELEVPLLVIHAREDEITSLASVERLVADLPTQDKQLAVVDNSYHMVTIDNDRQQVAGLLAAFVKRLTSAQVSLQRPSISDFIPLANAA
jgi:carboxylesterase